MYRGTYRGAAGVVKAGTVMQMTARSWLASPLSGKLWFALRARFVASRHGDCMKLLFVLLFVGVFLESAGAFGDTVSTIEYRAFVLTMMQ